MRADDGGDEPPQQPRRRRCRLRQRGGPRVGRPHRLAIANSFIASWHAHAASYCHFITHM
jgi:hypothetical protein